MLFIKILLITTLMVIFTQDYRSRMVSVLLFPVAALFFGALHFLSTDSRVFLMSIGVNMAFIAIILLILYLYAALKLKTRFINGSFGMGDLWFFVAIGLGFPTVTFVVLFAFSILFSLVLHLLFKQSVVSATISIRETVPLAGYMSLFFALVLSISVFCNFPALYLA